MKVPILALHGKMKEKRSKILERFRTSNEALLLCTDVMARGIDIPEVIYKNNRQFNVRYTYLQVDWVIQWDPPSNASAFVHRVGRTARQGQEGSALIMLLESEEAYVTFIEKNQKVQLIEREDSVNEENASLFTILFD